MSDLDTKERILTAAVEVLQSTESPEAITVRQLAEKAGVAVGAINYHFQSRDHLLNLAIGRIMSAEAAAWYEPLAHPEVDPVTRLRRLVKETGKIAFRYRRLSMISATYELMNGDFNVPLLIVPILREVFGERKSEMELRLLAFQLIVTTQVAFLRTETFKRYLGVDCAVDSERDAMVDILIDHLTENR